MRREPRPLAIIDLLILVATVAAGLALGEVWHRELLAGLPEFTSVPLRTQDRSLVAGRCLSALLPFTLGTIVLRMRRPRPRLRLMLRQPGSVACLAATTALVIQSVGAWLDLKTMGGFASPLLVAAWYWPIAICSAVAASWLALIGGRGWHPGDWTDRLGVLVGLGWVGLPLLLCLVEFG